MTWNEKVKAWWLAYRKKTEGFCEKHQVFESRFIGCEQCFLDDVRKFAEEDAQRREVRLQHIADINAKAIVDEMERRKHKEIII